MPKPTTRVFLKKNKLLGGLKEFWLNVEIGGFPPIRFQK